jgi:Domain of unknown function (DUF427)
MQQPRAIKIPGPDHPITLVGSEIRVVVRVAGHLSPIPGECSYYSIQPGGERSRNAVWTYEAPYAAVSAIKECLAFYPERVDSIEIGACGSHLP